MEIRINFEAENSSFVDDFDGEIKYVLKQAENFLVGNMENDVLRDTNGNSVGRIWISTCSLPR